MDFLSGKGRVTREDIYRTTLQALLTAARPNGEEARSGVLRIPHLAWSRLGAEWGGAKGDFLFKLEGDDITIRWQEEEEFSQEKPVGDPVGGSSV